MSCMKYQCCVYNNVLMIYMLFTLIQLRIVLINCESSVIVYTLLLIVSGIFKNLVRKNN